MPIKNYFVYILRCSDGSYYTGWTTDVTRRVKEHNNKTASKYTRTRVPVHCVYEEQWPSKRDAQKREWAIKQLSRAQKEALIAQGVAACKKAQ